MSRACIGVGMTGGFIVLRHRYEAADRRINAPFQNRPSWERFIKRIPRALLGEPFPGRETTLRFRWKGAFL